ncbi:MAG: hypothetical protein K8S27_08525 [Candidatus Omnitrophica bacterium]|nr:hypothetical protein [Candidatus Omnitrophota bacterium]
MRYNQSKKNTLDFFYYERAVLGVIVFMSLFFSAGWLCAREDIDKKTEEEEKPEVTLATLQTFCFDAYVIDGECPPEICQLKIVEDEKTRVMSMFCVPKTCVELPADQCPVDMCQIMQGCDDQPVCYDQMDLEPPVCGGLAYSGQDVDCCKGLKKRCGVEFFDGSCDMLGKNSIYSIPVCLPCGNGICNQFENSCNCPEDCRKRK